LTDYITIDALEEAEGLGDDDLLYLMRLVGEVYVDRKLSLGALAAAWVDPGARYTGKIYLVGAQSIPNAVLTDVVLNMGSWGEGGCVDLGTYPASVIAPVAGVYLLNGQIAYAASAAGIRGARILQGGSTVVGHVRGLVGSATVSSLVSVTALVKVTALAYFGLSAYQTSGGALDALDTVANTWLAIARVGL
jgi:hypothetical protein